MSPDGAGEPLPLFTFNDEDIDALLDGRQPEQEFSAPTPSEELSAVAQRIAVQYAEVIAQVASMLFAGRDSEGLIEQLDATLEALERLALASHAEAEHLLLSELRTWTAEYREGLLCGGRGRARYLDRLRAWLPRYAAQLGPGAQNRLKDLTRDDLSGIPLFEELEGLRGIGPRRLRRLYLAGLHTVEAVSAADPHELAQVAGLPLALAQGVVERAQDFASRRRRLAVLEMHRRLSEFMGVVRSMRPDDDPDLYQAALRAIAEMSEVARKLSQTG